MVENKYSSVELGPGDMLATKQHRVATASSEVIPLALSNRTHNIPTKLYSKCSVRITKVRPRILKRYHNTEITRDIKDKTHGKRVRANPPPMCPKSVGS